MKRRDLLRHLEKHGCEDAGADGDHQQQTDVKSACGRN